MKMLLYSIDVPAAFKCTGSCRSAKWTTKWTSDPAGRALEPAGRVGAETTRIRPRQF